jgi:hypothetical protein
MVRVRWFRAIGLAAIGLMFSLGLAAQGDLGAIQQKLQQRIILAKLDSNGEIAAAGSVVTLQKGELQMCATNAPPGAGAPANTYKNGKLSAGMFLWRLGLGLLKIDPNTIAMHTYVTGDKFWIVGMNVKKNGIEFKLWTDADANNIRYWSWLEIPFEKKQIPSADELMNTIAEVLAVPPTDEQNGPPPPETAQAPADQTPPAGPPPPTFTAIAPPPPPADVPAPMPAIAPPPPVDTPPPTIALGQTMDQVTTGFGQPQKVARVGAKTIFYYKDMKVTFASGKVSDVE